MIFLSFRRKPESSLCNPTPSQSQDVKLSTPAPEPCDRLENMNLIFKTAFDKTDFLLAFPKANL